MLGLKRVPGVDDDEGHYPEADSRCCRRLLGGHGRRGGGAAGAQAQGQRFPDVPPDHDAYEAVEWAAEAEVTTGYTDGTFKPERPLIKRHAVVFMERYYDEVLGADQSDDFTRGDMMVLLKSINDGNVGQSSEPTGTDPAGAQAQGQRFPDVPPDHYAYEAVEWAAEVEVTTGYTDGTFKPERPLIKRHAVVFMERYYDEVLGADQSDDFTRGDMMVLLKSINDGARLTAARAAAAEVTTKARAHGKDLKDNPEPGDRAQRAANIQGYYEEYKSDCEDLRTTYGEAEGLEVYWNYDITHKGADGEPDLAMIRTEATNPAPAWFDWIAAFTEHSEDDPGGYRNKMGCIAATS